MANPIDDFLGDTPTQNPDPTQNPTAKPSDVLQYYANGINNSSAGSALQGYGQGVTAGAIVYPKAIANYAGNWLLGGDYAASNSWKQALADSRSEMADSQAAHPGAYALGNLAGGAQLAYMTGGLGGTGTAANVARSAIQGGVQGYTANNSNGLQNDLTDTAEGAGIGAGLGVLGSGANWAQGLLKKKLVGEIAENAGISQEAAQASVDYMNRPGAPGTGDAISSLASGAWNNVKNIGVGAANAAIPGAIGATSGYLAGPMLGLSPEHGAELGGLLLGGSGWKNGMKAVQSSTAKELTNFADNSSMYLANRYPTVLPRIGNTVANTINSQVKPASNNSDDITQLTGISKNPTSNPLDDFLN